MIKILDIDNTLVIKSSVSEFIFCMGYCEYKIPFYVGGIKPPKNLVSIIRKNEGRMGHKKEEKIEIEKIEKGLIKQITKEEMFTFLPYTEKNIEFTREDITTKLIYQTKIDAQNVELSLTGRADKILRRDECLIVQEDKFPRNPTDYINRDMPFRSQVLQTLIYLNSKFKKKDATITLEDIWLSKDIKKLSDVRKSFEIPHKQKKWIINIRDIEEGNIVKTYEGIQTEQDKIYLEGNLYRFICLILGKKEKIHHNSSRKCNPCEYAPICHFSLKLSC